MEMKYIQKAFDSNWIAPVGTNIDGFEKNIADFVGNDCHVVALNSGTSALHLALILAGVKLGDEVICQSFTFVATANPILYLGAKPVFVDSEERTWNMSPFYMEQAIKDRIRNGKVPKAIIVVHLYGMPASMEEILKIANFYNIPVIEDAAEAFGSSINKRMVGTFGEMGILSFNGNKIITTSGGGALISKKRDTIEKALFLSTQAQDKASNYQHSEIGYNYRLSNVCAGIGLGQMAVLNLRISQRRKNFYTYKRLLSSVSEIKFLEEPNPGYYSNRWLTTILIENGTFKKIDIINELKSKGIETRCLWKPMHLQPIFKNYSYYGADVSTSLFNCGLCLPSGSDLSLNDLSFIIKKFKISLSKYVTSKTKVLL